MEVEFDVHPDTDSSWKDAGVCSGMTQVFFGPASERPERRGERENLARSICYACPVKLACRREGRMNLEHGIWGGENDEERALAGHTPRSPSRRSVIAAQKVASQTAVETPTERELQTALAS